jgi:hypothetical protein
VSKIVPLLLYFKLISCSEETDLYQFKSKLGKAGLYKIKNLKVFMSSGVYVSSFNQPSGIS